MDLYPGDEIDVPFKVSISKEILTYSEHPFSIILDLYVNLPYVTGKEK